MLQGICLRFGVVLELVYEFGQIDSQEHIENADGTEPEEHFLGLHFSYNEPDNGCEDDADDAGDSFQGQELRGHLQSEAVDDDGPEDHQHCLVCRTDRHHR